MICIQPERVCGYRTGPSTFMNIDAVLYSDAVRVPQPSYLRQGGYVITGVFSVCLSICLSVVCWQLHVKTTQQNFMKILPQMYLFTRKILLDFCSHPLRDHEYTKLKILISPHYLSLQTATPLDAVHGLHRSAAICS